MFSNSCIYGKLCLWWVKRPSYNLPRCIMHMQENVIFSILGQRPIQEVQIPQTSKRRLLSNLNPCFGSLGLNGLAEYIPYFASL